jgi:Flp pilus assembly protein TadG
MASEIRPIDEDGMSRFLHKLWNDKRGNALIIIGASLPLLVGAAGLATDTIQWSLWKRQLQRAADSAAIAGVYTRIGTDTETAVKSAVTTDLAINHHTGIALSTGFPKVALPADDGAKKKQVKVTLEISKALPFSSMFMAAAPAIHATATAASVPGGSQYCIIGLDPSVAVTGVEISGSAYVDLGDCSLIANSTNPTKAASNGASSGGGKGSTVKAASLAAAGGVQYSSSWDVKDYDPNSPAASDPFKDVEKPKSGDCTPDKTITNMDKNSSYPMDRTVGPDKDIAGQTVCITGPVTIKGALKLQTGVTYIVNGGDLTMNATGSSLTCVKCTIAMTNFTNPAATGNIKLTGGTIDISAQTSGNYKGIALYQDPRATDSGSKTQNQINGNNGQSITGAIYIPNQSVLYNGGGSYSGVGTEEGACMMLIGKRVEFGGNSKIKALDKCTGAGLPGPEAGQRVRLVA